ncbi:hypothetical protein [Streptomyces sp. NPDC056069]|uniref:hypothetical protein n=1 Tax=Streptomyces sp. NPDC056069 TaxID=3345702 RepID=UPI0035DFBC55
MSETTPEANDHGPAPAQMSPEQAASLGLAPTEPALIPADQVKPEDIGTLKIEYRDGQPVIVISGGPAIPAGIVVADESGNSIALYSAGPTPDARGASAHVGNLFSTDLFYSPDSSMFNLLK